VNEGLEKLSELMRRLRVATASGSVTWEMLGKFAYSFSSPKSSVYVSADDDGGPPYTIEIYDSDGAMVEQYHSALGARHERLVQANTDLAQLYEAIRRRVLRVDDVLDELLDELPPDPDPFAGLPPF